MTKHTPMEPGSRILVVDDDPAIRFLAREALEQSGFRVEEASDGPEALSAMDTLQPDMILLDVLLPKMNGFAVCTALRHTMAGKHVPILIMTGLEDTDSINQAYEAGATDFVVKPINWVILGHRVRYMLRASAALRKIRESEARLANAQRIAHLGNWEWNLQNDKLEGSTEVYRIFGLEPPQSVNTYQDFFKLIHPEDKDHLCQAINKALQEKTAYNIDHRIVRPHGEERTVHIQAEVLCDDSGAPQNVSGIIQDITDRKRAEDKISYLAYYDTLTGLPNRQSLMRDLQFTLDLAERHGWLLAILFLDLDNFKRINDTLGHAVGDRLLQAVAQRLLQSIRATDRVARRDMILQNENVARLGGDEFTVLLTEIQQIQDSALVAQRILDTLTKPLKIDTHEIVVTPSIGIAIYPHDGQDVDQLLKNADIAMYHAKEAGKNTYKYYAESMNARALERLHLESHLRKALEKNEFFLCYQPQLDLQSNTIIGAEVLLRWQNPELGLISPADFIPLAEETGLIVAIGEWTLRYACEQNKIWQTIGYPPIRIAVNVSSLQFRQQNLAALIQQTLVDSELNANYLELELTESIIMHNAEETIETLKTLKKMGLTLSVDDFGTGYSSLSYLKRFPLDTLKIDQSFIRDITHDSDNAAISTAIIAMAHSLNLTVIAEGVETEQQLAFLRQHHCDMAQGYLIGRPLTTEQFTNLLHNSSTIFRKRLY